MEGLNQIYCSLTGKETPMKIRLLLRVLNALIIVVLYKKAGIDWVIVYGLVIIVSDLDSIAEAVNEKLKKKCE